MPPRESVYSSKRGQFSFSFFLFTIIINLLTYILNKSYIKKNVFLYSNLDSDKRIGLSELSVFTHFTNQITME